jgi:hypothetical protein
MQSVQNLHYVKTIFVCFQDAIIFVKIYKFLEVLGCKIWYLLISSNFPYIWEMYVLMNLILTLLQGL